jgi:hypothetical protein
MLMVSRTRYQFQLGTKAKVCRQSASGICPARNHGVSMRKSIAVMTKARLPIVLSGLLCMSGLVLAQEVKYNFDPSVDFSKYHTYQWVSLSTAHPDQLVDRQIKSAVDAQLAAKGLTQTNSNPDLQVAYQVAVNQEKQWNGWGMGRGFGGGMGTATSSTIKVGTLGIDFFDPATKNLVWRGLGTKTIDPSGNPEKNMQRMQKAIAKILKNFPPKSRK